MPAPSGWQRGGGTLTELGEAFGLPRQIDAVASFQPGPVAVRWQYRQGLAQLLALARAQGRQIGGIVGEGLPEDRFERLPASAQSRQCWPVGQRGGAEQRQVAPDAGEIIRQPRREACPLDQLEDGVRQRDIRRDAQRFQPTINRQRAIENLRRRVRDGGAGTQRNILGPCRRVRDLRRQVNRPPVGVRSPCSSASRLSVATSAPSVRPATKSASVRSTARKVSGGLAAIASASGTRRAGRRPRNQPVIGSTKDEGRTTNKRDLPRLVVHPSDFAC